MDNNNFKLGDIVYDGWKFYGEITTNKNKLVKINPKSYNVISPTAKDNYSRRVKYIFKTEEECIDFYKNR